MESKNEKQKKPSQPVDHHGHRQRLKRRAALEGIDSFEAHNLLELLLFYTIPRADTNETGHRLLESFGSFSAVLDASPEALMRVDGVGPETAQFLHMLPAVFRYYESCKYEMHKRINDVDQLMNSLISKFVGQTNESLFMVCLDCNCAISKCICLAQGQMDKVQVDPKLVATEALSVNAKGVFLAHNHPSGTAKPSSADYSGTKAVANVLNLVDIPLVEHYVIADGRAIPLSKDVRFKSFIGSEYRNAMCGFASFRERMQEEKDNRKKG